MGNRLYVGNLSFSTTQATLEQTFAAIGEVREVAIPTDRETGQPRGFAFVTMGNAQAASAAIQKLNGSVLDGRQLKVNEAQERPPRGGACRDLAGSFLLARHGRDPRALDRASAGISA